MVNIFIGIVIAIIGISVFWLVKQLPLTIKVKYLNDVPELKRIKQGDWVDLYLYEDVSMVKGEISVFSLGLSMKLPRNYEAIMAPRSSTILKHKVMVGNSIGIIDNSYNGDDDVWGIILYALDNTFIPKGTRIAQFRVIKNQPKLKFISVESLLSVSRGGMGSTGD